MISLQNAIVYDIESFHNCFTFAMETLYGEQKAVWEISGYRDDRASLMQFWQYLAQTQTLMIGYNNVGYDYLMIDHIFRNPTLTAQQIRAKNDEIFASQHRYGQMIWADRRFAPQLDLFKMMHFDNKAKMTSLKKLQINMRSPNVVENELGFDRPLTEHEINTIAIPYNQHDVSETKQFALHNLDAIHLRLSLIETYGLEVLNWNDTKIGEELVVKRLGRENCFDYSSGKRVTKQTPRTEIALKDIIFPYVQFEHPEFNRILTYLKSQVLKAKEIEGIGSDGYTPIVTKGVFTDLKAVVEGVEYYYGVGGIHGSVKAQKVLSTDEWLIRDIDVASLYPNIAIQNNLAPAHLGQAFVNVYSEIPKERKQWQAQKGKKCSEANALKLAANGVYGKSNSMFSPFYDPQFTMTITVNGQLLLSMLVEKLIKVPTLKVIQANTDGITYYIHRDHEPKAKQVCSEWESLTRLTLEDADYNRMFIRDVNSYIAEAKDGSLKLKGAYWTADPLDYHSSVANAQPPAWHKNLSNMVSVRAAVSHMVHGTDIEQFIRLCTNPYDFMLMVQIRKSDELLWGVEKQQRNSRFYISTNGQNLIKRQPPKGKPGAYKRAPKVSEDQYLRIMKETNWEWDERVCTKNKSVYEISDSSIAAGYLTTMCNNVDSFNFDTVDYSYYVNEAEKLVIKT